MLKKILPYMVFCFFFGNQFALGGTEGKIIAFGDSITTGAWEYRGEWGGGERVGGYEPDLEELTASRCNPFIVLNYGVAGEKTTFDRNGDEVGSARLERILPQHPDARYVLILEGTNDYWSGVSRDATADTLGQMVDYSRTQGIEPIIATLTPDTTYPVKNIPLYNELITAMALEKEVKLVDMYTPMVDQWESLYAAKTYPNGVTPDFTHLSREGYHKMAELWFEVIAPFCGLPWLHLLVHTP